MGKIECERWISQFGINEVPEREPQATVFTLVEGETNFQDYHFLTSSKLIPISI